MRIKNYSQLAVNETRKIALDLIEVGLAAIDTEKVVTTNVRIKEGNLLIKNESLSLKNIGRILVVAVGKCALQASAVLEEILGDLITTGITLDVKEGKLKHFKSYRGSHPFPSDANVRATSEIIQLLSDLTEKDLVIFAISGGGSTLLCQPQNMTHEEESGIFKDLTRQGATIKEINTVRKHISLARGGYLAKLAYPAKIVSLIFSDVPGNDLNFIASGPTVKDITTITDAKKVIEKYQIQTRCDLPENALIETPKDEKYFEKVRNILIVSNRIALEVMAQKASDLGFNAKIMTDVLVGEAKEVGLKILKDLDNISAKTVILYGGETTVKVSENHGEGGRNQALVLSALRNVQDGQLVISFASDGRDNTGFAGAICDMITKEKAEKLGLDIGQYLDRNDSYNFFRQTKDYIETGETGSNVSDLIIAIKR